MEMVQGSILVSIIMPAYNCENYIAEAINSVREQTYTNWELLIIDDCSSDNTLCIIKKFSNLDKRIKIYKNCSNKGVAYSRNVGIKNSLGKYIAFLDADDVWMPQKMQKQVDILSTEIQFCFSASYFINEVSDKISDKINVPTYVTFNDLLKQNVIPCSSVVLSKNILKKYSFENDNLHEDYLLWLKILKNENITAHSINESLLKYRISSNSKSANKIKSALMTLKVYKIIELNPFHQMYYFINYLVKSIKKYSMIDQ